MIYAVLTGDIVKSSALSPTELDATLEAVRFASVVTSSWGPVDTATGFARRGGDGWQISFAAPHLSLRAALLVQAHVRREGKTRATRITIATGDATPPETPDLNAAHGPAFTASGRLLDDLPNGILMSHAAGGAQAATLHLADHIARGWTKAQARALCEMLVPAPGPRAEAAKRLGISRQAVDQALWAAGFPALEAAMQAWEAAKCK